jgi:hypothetical protein
MVKNLAEYYHRAAVIHYELGHHSRSAKAAEQSYQIWPSNDPDKSYKLAWVLAWCIKLVKNDAALDEAQKQDFNEIYGKRAVEYLQKGAERAFLKRKDLDYRDRFESLRDRQDFKKLQKDLEIKERKPRVASFGSGQDPLGPNLGGRQVRPATSPSR